MCAWKIAVCTFRLFDLLHFYPDKQMLENPNLLPFHHPDVHKPFFQRGVMKRKPWSFVWAMFVHPSVTQNLRKKFQPKKLINKQKTFDILSPKKNVHFWMLLKHLSCWSACISVTVVWVTTYIFLCKRLGVCFPVTMVTLDPGDFGLILAPISSVSSCRGSPGCGRPSSCWFR